MDCRKPHNALWLDKNTQAVTWLSCQQDPINIRAQLHLSYTHSSLKTHLHVSINTLGEQRPIP